MSTTDHRNQRIDAVVFQSIISNNYPINPLNFLIRYILIMLIDELDGLLKYHGTNPFIPMIRCTQDKYNGLTESTDFKIKS